MRRSVVPFDVAEEGEGNSRPLPIAIPVMDDAVEGEMGAVMAVEAVEAIEDLAQPLMAYPVNRPNYRPPRRPVPQPPPVRREGGEGRDVPRQRDPRLTAEADHRHAVESVLVDPTPYLHDLLHQDLPCGDVLAGRHSQSCDTVISHVMQFPSDALYQCPRTSRTPLHIAAMRCACTHVLHALCESTKHLLLRPDQRGNCPIHLLFVGLATQRVPESIALHMLDLLLASPTQSSFVAALRNREGLRPLHMACAGPSGMIPASLILKLLDANPSVASFPSRDWNQTPLLMYCAHQPLASVEVVDRLVAAVRLHHNNNTDDRDRDTLLGETDSRGWNCLHYSAHAGNGPVILSLLRLAATAAPPSQQPSGGAARTLALSRSSSETWTALHILMQKRLSDDRHLPAIRALVEVAPEALTIRDFRTQATPLHMLLQSKFPPSIAIVRLFIDAVPGASFILDGNQYLPLHTACEKGVDPTIVQLLLEKHPHAASCLTKRRDTPLSLACTANRSLETVQQLLQAHPKAVTESNAYGFLPLHCLCRAYQPRLDLIQALVDADPTSVSMPTHNGDETALHLAMNNSSVSTAVVQALTAAMMAASATTPKEGSPLERVHGLSAVDSPKETSSSSSALPPPISCKVENTPLHLACFRGAPLETIESLIQTNSGWISARNNAGYTPIQILCQSARIEPEAIRLFARLGGPNVFAVVDVMGNTPLHSAMREDTDPQALLLLMQANPEALHSKTIYDDTPLHVACLRKVHPEVVREVALASSSVKASDVARSRGRLSPLVAQNTAGQAPIGIAMEEFERLCLWNSSSCCVKAEYSPDQQRAFDILASLVCILHDAATLPSIPLHDDDTNENTTPPSLLAACLSLHRIDIRLHPAFIRRVLHVQPESARRLVDQHGNYPLHLEASIPIEKMGLLDGPSTTPSTGCCGGSCHRRLGVLRRLWELHPTAAARANDSDDFPLTLMVQNGRPWDDAFALIVQGNPTALHSLRSFDARALQPRLLRRLYDRIGPNAVLGYLRCADGRIIGPDRHYQPCAAAAIASESEKSVESP